MHVTYDLIWFALESFGGISRMWEELFKRLPDPEIDPGFIVGPADNKVQDFLEKNDFFGGRVHREPAAGFYQKLRRLGFYRSLHLMAHNGAGKGERIFHSTDYINPLWSKPSLKIVTTIHDMVFHDQPQAFVNNIWYKDKYWSTYHACRTSDLVVSVSETTKKRIVAHYPWAEEKIRVIHHGLDASLAQIPLRPEKQKRVLFVGGRNGHKNFDLLAHAFAALAPDYPDWELHLVGPNAHSREREAELFDTLGIRERTTDHGLVPQETLVELLQIAGALVIPSLNEGFNFPLLEGMAAGCPVLSSDIPVSVELGEGRARFFDPRDQETLTAQLRRLADNPPGSDELAANQAYARTFQWEKSFAALKDVYREALGGSR